MDKEARDSKNMETIQNNVDDTQIVMTEPIDDNDQVKASDTLVSAGLIGGQFRRLNEENKVETINSEVHHNQMEFN